MLADGGGGPKGGKKGGKKPPKGGGGSSSSGGGYDATPRGYGSAPKQSQAYHKPVYNPPPSYSTVSRKPNPGPVAPPKPPSIFDVLKNLGVGVNRNPVEAKQEQNDLAFLLKQPLGGKPDQPELTAKDKDLPEGMQKFLASLRGNDVAPKGYTPGAEKQGATDFAWVPEKFKTRKNGRLKSHWDADFIEASREDFTYPSQFQTFLNDMMEAQFQDREEWLLGKNERKYNKIKEILGNASQAAFKGDYDYLEREHPNFDPSIPTYRSKFGVTPEQITDNWMDTRDSIKDPYMRPALRFRMDKMREHYEKLRSGTFFSYQQTNNLVNRAIKKYEDKYNDSVEFGLSSSDEARKAAAEAAGPAMPKSGRSKEDQEYADLVGDARDPRGSDAFATFFGSSSKAGRKSDRRAVEKARTKAMGVLGTANLPSVKQMLTYAISNGDLDPDNEQAVEAAIDRYKNPNHPDTRAMYVAFTMSRNPEFDAEGVGLDYINDPVVRYNKDLQKRAAANAQAELEADLNEQTGPLDLIGDAWKSMEWNGIPTVDVRPFGGGGQGAKGTEGNEGALSASQLGWTFDKLLRLNYGVAGMADAWYGLDKDPKSRSWTDMFDPIGLVAGQSSASSLDEVIKDPSGLGKVFDAGYQQVFRGSGLPGIEDKIVPMTFSHVIANNAARDPEGNIYDKEWYQHVAGFGLDVIFDPLNLIGVGVVDDVLKVPARVAKGLKQAEKGDEASVDIINFLNRVEDRSRSPIAEKVYRTDQSIRRLGDDISGKEYADDLDIWMPDKGITNQYDHDAVLRDISNQMDDLRIQEAKLKNDLGIEAMTDELSNVMAQHSTLAFRSKVDFRFNRIAKRTQINIKDTDLTNPGGAFWRDYLDPLEKGAKHWGFYDVEYAPTSLGKAAQKAEDDLTRLLDDIDAGKLLEGDAAVAAKKAQLERTIDEGYAVDPATGKPSIGKVARIEEYRKSKHFQKPKMDPAKVLADSAGISKEDFAKHFSDEDVHKALTQGPRMLVESDEAAAKMLMDARERIHYAKEQLAQPGITESKKKAVQQALRAGYEMESNVTIEGMLRYLDTLQDMRRGGKVPNVRQQVDELETQVAEINAKIDDLYDEGVGGQEVIDETGGDYYGGFQGMLDSREKSPGQQLVDELFEQRDELQGQIDELLPQLSNTDEVTGFPPAQAYQVERMVPPDSVFRGADGKISPEQVAKFLEFEDSTHTVKYKKPEGATPDEVAFLDLVTDTIRAEYHGAYRAVKTETIKARHAKSKPKADDEVGDGAWGGSDFDYLVRDPKTGDIKPYWEVEGKPKPEGTVVGKEEAKLGPRPTAKSLREQFPQIFEKYTKGYPPKDGAPPKGFRVEENVEFRGGVKGVPGDWVQTAPKVVETGGKRSPAQKTLDEFIARKQREWDKRVVRARELDAGAARKATPEFKVTQKERNLIAQKAYKRAEDGVLASLKSGEVKRVPGNMRLTINEHAKQLTESLNLQHRADMARLKIEELNAKGADELRLINAKRAALEKQKKKYEAEIEAARKTAHETKKNVERIIKDEHVLQIAQMPVRATGRMMQLRIMGMRKNMQFTNNLFRGAGKAAELVPAQMRERFANYFVRPTKQLDTHEAIMFRAQWESKTPVIIKAHLQRASMRMRDIPETERVAMLKAYRDGVDYEGPHMHLYDEAMEEMREVEKIWNGTHDFYKFQPKRGDIEPVPLHVGEIVRFLPKAYQPQLDVLFRYIGEDGVVTTDNLLKAIKATPDNKMQDLLDPFRFSWTMRLAADQARQYKALTHAIERTFAVDLSQSAKKVKFANKLRATGWTEVKGLNGLFPPEAANDVKKLLELAEPGPAQNQFTKVVDDALGYWKQSMTIYNPGYYTRNGVGEIMTSWLDGVNHPKWYRMAYRVHRFAKREDQDLARLVERWSALDGKIPVDVAGGGEVLFKLPKSGVKVTIDEALRAYTNMGLKSTFANTDIGQGVRGLSGSALHDSKLRKGLSKTNEKVHDVGEGFEDYLRMAHFLHAMEHSKAGTIDQAAKLAAQRVTRSHFDYTDFSTFEKSVMVRAFPFYKWTRRGAPLMFAHLFMTPGKMGALPKAMDTMSGLGFDPVGVVNDDPVFSTSDVHDDVNGHLPDYQGIAPGWVRDLFAYQVSPAEDDEYGNYFRMQTPQVDGLNSVLNALPIPGTDNNAGMGMDMFTESGAYPLLNPVVKGAIELGTNQSMDPDFPFPILGGDYNEMNDLSKADSLGIYAARNTSPVLGFLAKLSKNGDLGPLSVGDGDYREERGYNTSRDIASFLTGAGFYQARHTDIPKTPDIANPSAVGKYNLSDIPEIRGRKAAGNYAASDGPTGKAPAYGSMQGYEGSGGSGWIDYPDYKGSGWINYPNNGWINYQNSYGGGGYGGYSGGSSSYSGGSSSSGLSIAEILDAIRAMIDQGQVYDG